MSPTASCGRWLRPRSTTGDPNFAELARQVLAGVGKLCGSALPVAIYPSSGPGAWEAALVNTLSPGDTVLASDVGHFAALWRELALRLGLRVDLLPGDWRRGVQPEQVAARLAADPEHRIKAVMVVHNETSTGVTSGSRSFARPSIVPAIRRCCQPAVRAARSSRHPQRARAARCLHQARQARGGLSPSGAGLGA